MKRREFLHRTACAAGAAWVRSSAFARRTFSISTLSGKFSAADTVTIGKTGIQTSRLAMGTGTVGVGHHSHQTALGIKGLSDLLLNGTIAACAFSIPPIPTAAILTSPKPSSMFPAIRSPCSPKPGRATPLPRAPILIASAANSAPIKSTSV